MSRSRSRIFALATLTVVLVGPGCKRAFVPPTEEVDPARVKTVVETPAERKPSPDQKQVLGTGWYANVEVDSQGRLHVAWTDADVGDVMYARVEASGQIGTIEPVEVMGAVGSYLKLALAPGDVPVLAYYHQTERTLRLAHREKDLPVMKAAGAEVKLDGEPAPRVIPGERPDPPDRMGPGWVGEDITFGDNVGLSGSLFVDDRGRPHVAYYARGERMRYARRPESAPAFGPLAHGVWELADVDPEAGASYTMSTDLNVRSDGTVAISFCHWNFVDAQLKVAIKGPNDERFRVAASPLQKAVDGWHSSVAWRDDGKLDVFSVATGDHELLHAVVDPAAPAIPEERPVLLERPGPTEVVRTKDGTLWVLTRGLGLESLGEPQGVWLARLEGADTKKMKRWLLDKGAASDPWLDLELLPDGRPVAVWTTPDHKGMKMYIHERP